MLATVTACVSSPASSSLGTARALLRVTTPIALPRACRSACDKLTWAGTVDALRKPYATPKFSNMKASVRMKYPLLCVQDQGRRKLQGQNRWRAHRPQDSSPLPASTTSSSHLGQLVHCLDKEETSGTRGAAVSFTPCHGTEFVPVSTEAAGEGKYRKSCCVQRVTKQPPNQACQRQRQGAAVPQLTGRQGLHVSLGTRGLFLTLHPPFQPWGEAVRREPS